MSQEKERRKYQRIPIGKSSLNLKMQVVHFGPAEIYDLSYGGLAMSHPATKKVDNVEQDLDLVFELQGQDIRLAAKVVRVNEDRVALSFVELTPQGRQMVDAVVTEPMIGLNMNLVDEKHYGRQSDFSHWFYGPQDTHLYLWVSEGTLVKGQMDMGGAVLVFTEDGFVFENKSQTGEALNNRQMAQRALGILQNMNFDMAALEEFRGVLEKHVQ